MMLRKAPKQFLHSIVPFLQHYWAIARLRTVAWFNPPHRRLRLRRRLFLYTAPAAALLAIVVAALITLVTAGYSAVDSFNRHDIEALRNDVDTLGTFGVVEPGTVAFAEADLLVLEGKLNEAEARFADALGRFDGDASCPVRVNLVLVRETLADLAVRSGRPDDADRLYNSALALVKEAPAGCFKDNADPNEDRRAVRGDAQPRLDRKLAALHAPPPPPPTGPAVVTPEPPPGPDAPQPSNAGGPPPPPNQAPSLPPLGQGVPGQGAPSTPPPPPLPGENIPQAPPPGTQPGASGEAGQGGPGQGAPSTPPPPPLPGENIPQAPPPGTQPGASGEAGQGGPGQPGQGQPGAAGQAPGPGENPAPDGEGQASAPNGQPAPNGEGQAPPPPPPPAGPPGASPGDGPLQMANPAAPNPAQILGPVGPDGLPLGDPNSSAPDLTLNRKDRYSTDPARRLQDLLEDSSSYGGERE
ncbi:tetratricopeptide repeat protein [Mycolicibacterium senegalense]|uniref:tetratricopeptide repeat protein n=1 Tax=Mycolicibacterium senegalense TaxID=1796 RepID=UPI003AB0B65D